MYSVSLSRKVNWLPFVSCAGLVPRPVLFSRLSSFSCRPLLPVFTEQLHAAASANENIWLQVRRRTMHDTHDTHDMYVLA